MKCMYDTGEAGLQGVGVSMVSGATSNNMHKTATDSGPTDARIEDDAEIKVHMHEIAPADPVQKLSPLLRDQRGR